MFQLRESHVEALGNRPLREFEREFIEFLREEFDDAKELPPCELKDAVHKNVLMAQSFGLKLERHLAMYLVTAWVLGSDFHSEFPAAHAMLNSPRHPASVKVDWLENWTRQIFIELEAKD